MSSYVKFVYSKMFTTSHGVLDYLHGNPGHWVVCNVLDEEILGWENLTIDVRVGIHLFHLRKISDSAHKDIFSTFESRRNLAYELTGKFVGRLPLSTKRILW